MKTNPKKIINVTLILLFVMYALGVEGVRLNDDIGYLVDWFVGDC